MSKVGTSKNASEIIDTKNKRNSDSGSANITNLPSQKNKSHHSITQKKRMMHQSKSSTPSLSLSSSGSSKKYKKKRRVWQETIFPEFKTFKPEKDYEFLKVLGKGAYGEVSLVKQKKNGYTYVCKTVPKIRMKKHDVVCIKNEVKYQKLFHSYHVLSFLDGYEVGTNIFLINPRCFATMKDTFTSLRPLEENICAEYIHKLLEALKVMHDLGVIHFDLKPENVGFLDENHTKICILDLGISDKVNEKTNSIKSRGGTPGYMSPESIRKEQCTAATDIFSIGVIVYECLYGFGPFDGPTATYPESTFANTFKGFSDDHFKNKRAKKHVVSDDAKNFIKICLSPDPQSRPTAVTALKHRFTEYNLTHERIQTIDLQEIIPYKFDDQPFDIEENDSD